VGTGRGAGDARRNPAATRWGWSGEWGGSEWNGFWVLIGESDAGRQRERLLIGPEPRPRYSGA
ncbi:MAG TPA: hypothetical protein PK308_11185, partial [Phycisphaerales bacterium]|nr:hypothetical protein [Phycisphaerales bacterium]